MIRDPIDKTLPEYNGQAVLSDIYSDRQIIVNVESIRDQYTSFVQAQEREVSQAFVESKADFVELTTDKPFIKPISDLFLRRAKKIR